MIAKYWQLLAQRFGKLSLRERSLILFGLLATCCLLIYSLVLEPRYDKAKLLTSQLTGLQQQLQQLSVDERKLLDVLASDPDKDVKVQIARTESELNNADTKLLLSTADLITANDMAAVLTDVLMLTDKVELLAMESLPATLLSNTEVVESFVDNKLQLYRHGLRITLAGQYFDILAYLDNVEHLPKQFFWQRFDYQIQDYPQATVIMEIFTLSKDKEFIRG